MTEKSMSQVCSLLGKRCSGPIVFYLNENGRLGLRLSALLKEADELEMSDLTDTPEYLDIFNSIHEGTMEKKLDHVINLTSPININIRELEIQGVKYPIEKGRYADEYTYIIEAPNIRKKLSSIMNAFALEAYLQSEMTKKTAPPPAPPVSPEPSGMGGFGPTI